MKSNTKSLPALILVIIHLLTSNQYHIGNQWAHFMSPNGKKASGLQFIVENVDRQEAPLGLGSIFTIESILILGALCWEFSLASCLSSHSPWEAWPLAWGLARVQIKGSSWSDTHQYQLAISSHFLPLKVGRTDGLSKLMGNPEAAGKQKRWQWEEDTAGRHKGKVSPLMETRQNSQAQNVNSTTEAKKPESVGQSAEAWDVH